ncbi:MAG: isoprenyl transferase, partial [Syntrophus sp. (in: bacteria)]|nr:isoprenyl transferase [Syntrophus sp. (in: bacteria)]
MHEHAGCSNDEKSGSRMINIDIKKLPRHIAVIMDGNGRWAQQHAMGRISGHKKGAEAVRTTVRTCREIGVKVLTLYAFSTENWLRPDNEVQALMRLLEEYLRSELREMLENGIRLTTIGDTEALKEPIKGILREAMNKTSQGQEMTLNLALSYGGRDEIISAIKKIALDVQTGRLSLQGISKENFPDYLHTAGLPDPDLLIRTSGEYRISNFLLWQSAYTEFYFTDVLWPDFNRDELYKAIAEFQRRERRFGLT